MIRTLHFAAIRMYFFPRLQFNKSVLIWANDWTRVSNPHAASCMFNESRVRVCVAPFKKHTTRPTDLQVFQLPTCRRNEKQHNVYGWKERKKRLEFVTLIPFHSMFVVVFFFLIFLSASSSLRFVGCSHLRIFNCAGIVVAPTYPFDRRR